MGYDVHITRRKQWFDEEGPSISFDEWAECVSSDSEMRMEGFAQFTNPKTDETIRFDSPGLAVWTGHSRMAIYWFHWCGGDVAVKNPDQETLRKMWIIARRLSAYVQGDDGETYDESGQMSQTIRKD